MGEYAEMMLDGTCCAECGEYLGSNAGYAVRCASCGGDGDLYFDVRDAMTAKPHACPHPDCSKTFTTKAGARQHFEAKHRERAQCPGCQKWFVDEKARDQHREALERRGGCGNGWKNSTQRREEDDDFQVIDLND